MMFFICIWNFRKVKWSWFRFSSLQGRSLTVPRLTVSRWLLFDCQVSARTSWCRRHIIYDIAIFGLKIIIKIQLKIRKGEYDYITERKSDISNPNLDLICWLVRAIALGLALNPVLTKLLIRCPALSGIFKRCSSAAASISSSSV